jgi:hypothetical protein
MKTDFYNTSLQKGNQFEKINSYQSANPSSQANAGLVGRRQCRIRP